MGSNLRIQERRTYVSRLTLSQILHDRSTTTSQMRMDTGAERLLPVAILTELQEEFRNELPSSPAKLSVVGTAIRLSAGRSSDFFVQSVNTSVGRFFG